MRREHLTIVLAALCGLVLTAGIAHLFLLRFRSGDIYPVYSSLRADPLGTKALYASLDACDGVRVRRNLDIMELPLDNPDATLLFLGDTIHAREFLSARMVARLNSFVRRGGRLVFTFVPRNIVPAPPEGEVDEEPAADGTNADETASAGEDEEQEEADDEEPDEEWGDWEVPDEVIAVQEWLQLEVRDIPNTGEGIAVLATNAGPWRLPREIDCRTSLCFTEPEIEDGTNAAAADAAWPWRTLYARDTYPVVIERSLGQGRIALCAMSFFVSNEALRDRRHPLLLSWLIGDSREVIFDETHHDIGSAPGLASLARRYRLHGLAAALLVLASLFAWKSASSLVPRRYAAGADPDRELAAGKGSAAGLTNLLRRNVPTRDILPTCFERWQQALPQTAAGRSEKTRRMRSVMQETLQQPPHKRDTVATYNRMAEIRNERS